MLENYPYFTQWRQKAAEKWSASAILKLNYITKNQIIPLYGEGNSNPLQYSCLEKPMDGRAWPAIVLEVAELDMTEWL